MKWVSLSDYQAKSSWANLLKKYTMSFFKNVQSERLVEKRSEKLGLSITRDIKLWEMALYIFLSQLPFTYLLPFPKLITWETKYW